MIMLITTAVGYPDSGYYLSGCTDGGDGSNYCWTACWNPFVVEPWCYTTESYSQSYSYITCESADECNADLKCGGPCGSGIGVYRD